MKRGSKPWADDRSCLADARGARAIEHRSSATIERRGHQKRKQGPSVCRAAELLSRASRRGCPWRSSRLRLVLLVAHISSHAEMWASSSAPPVIQKRRSPISNGCASADAGRHANCRRGRAQNRRVSRALQHVLRGELRATNSMNDSSWRSDATCRARRRGHT